MHLFARAALVFGHHAADRIAVGRAVALLARVHALVAAHVLRAHVRASIFVDAIAVVALFFFFDHAVAAAGMFLLAIGVATIADRSVAVIALFAVGFDAVAASVEHAQAGDAVLV